MEIRVVDTHSERSDLKSNRRNAKTQEVGYQPRAAAMMILVQTLSIRNHHKFKKLFFNLLRCLFKECKRELSLRSTRESSFRSSYRVNRSFVSSRSLSPNLQSNRHPKAVRTMVRVIDSFVKFQCFRFFTCLRALRCADSQNQKVLYKSFSRWNGLLRQKKRIKAFYRVLNSKLFDMYRIVFSKINVRQLPLPHNIHDYIDDILFIRESSARLEYSSKFRGITSPTRWQ